MKKNIFVATVTFILTCTGWGMTFHNSVGRIKVKTVIVRDTIIPDFVFQHPKEGLKEALSFYNIKYPEIVYAQAILETGHFTSGGCNKDNNLFGISPGGKHTKFSHWIESVIAYRDQVQYKYRPNEDYFHFLTRIGYAEDPHYNNKLKSILK